MVINMELLRKAAPDQKYKKLCGQCCLYFLAKQHLFQETACNNKTNLTKYKSYYKKQDSEKSSFRPDSIKVLRQCIKNTLFVVTSFLDCLPSREYEQPQCP